MWIERTSELKCHYLFHHEDFQFELLNPGNKEVEGKRKHRMIRQKKWFSFLFVFVWVCLTFFYLKIWKILHGQEQQKKIKKKTEDLYQRPGCCLPKSSFLPYIIANCVSLILRLNLSRYFCSSSKQMNYFHKHTFSTMRIRVENIFTIFHPHLKWKTSSKSAFIIQMYWFSKNFRSFFCHLFFTIFLKCVSFVSFV